MENNPQPDQQYYDYKQQQPQYPPPLPTRQGKTQVLQLDYNIAGLLCYVPFGFIAAIVFLLTEPKENRFVRFHAIQSLLFLAAVVALGSVLNVFGFILGQVPFLGWIFTLIMIPLSLLISFGSLALMVFLIVKAYQYQMWQIPFIGPYADRIAQQ
jgi:uncharacterized membrane protein